MLVLGMLAVLPAIGCHHTVYARDGHPVQEPSYAYGTNSFKQFVKESYKVCNAGDCAQFFSSFEDSFRAVSGKTLHAWLESARLAVKGAADDEPVLNVCADLHRVIKKTIPKFSLDRGYEFANTQKLGERQCLLQSVLIAGILQSAGLKAGMVMVWANPTDGRSNLGHVVCVVHLPSKNSVLVDASDPTPFIQHKGLWLQDKATGNYLFVRPAYTDAGIIRSYQAMDGGSDLTPENGAALSIPFIKSQFDFYRGERTPGGLLAANPTPEGLKQSEFFLARAVQECPNNSLALYSLGKVHLKQNNPAGKDEIRRAYAQYQRAGWVPKGVADAYSQIGG